METHAAAHRTGETAIAQRRLIGWVLAMSLSIDGAIAGAEACLSCRGSADATVYANQQGPGTPEAQARSARPATQVATGQARNDPNWQLQAVPVRRAPTAQRKCESSLLTVEADRTALISMVAAGVVGGFVLILVAFGVRRWRSTISKVCRYCGTKKSRDARAGRHCFHALRRSDS